MIINFGKYKGQHISALKADSEYCKWLISTSEKDPQSFVANFVRNYLNNTPTQSLENKATNKLYKFLLSKIKVDTYESYIRLYPIYGFTSSYYPIVHKYYPIDNKYNNTDDSWLTDVYNSNCESYDEYEEHEDDFLINHFNFSKNFSYTKDNYLLDTANIAINQKGQIKQYIFISVNGKVNINCDLNKLYSDNVFIISAEWILNHLHPNSERLNIDKDLLLDLKPVYTYTPLSKTKAEKKIVYYTLAYNDELDEEINNKINETEYILDTVKDEYYKDLFNIVVKHLSIIFKPRIEYI